MFANEKLNLAKRMEEHKIMLLEEGRLIEAKKLTKFISSTLQEFLIYSGCVRADHFEIGE
ncbi:MAG: hypothetical protein WC389_03630 [Lutibacter sp.]